MSSTPHDRPGEDSPGSSGEPAPAPRPPAPGAYDTAPHPPTVPGASQPPAPSYPGSQPGSGYAYSPYGYPLGTGADDLPREPVRRPGVLVLALVLLLLSAVPYLFFGTAALVAPLTPADFPPDLLDEPAFAQAGLTLETLVRLVRVVGVVSLVLALVYALLAVLAFGGRNWARITITVLTGLFVLLIGFGTVSLALAGDLASALVSALLLAPAVAGVVLLFVRSSNEWYRSRSR